jgi:glyoxylase-like metal-dependent hydrolase (beta-lactamase superfamily II)
MKAQIIGTIALFIAGALPASAPARQTKPQAPGFYRLLVGAIEVTALNDGVVSYRTAQLLPTATPEQISKSLYEAGLTDPWGMSYNAYLINTGDKLVLIDTGTGGKLADSPFFAGAGRLVANLRASGYRPELIDEIYITHLGPDHVGGLTKGKQRAFPNAILRAARSEVAVFLKPDAAQTNPKDWRIPFWRDLFQPYINAGKFQPFDEDGPLANGIRAVTTPGHTPGHTSYLIESKGQKLLVLGDLILVAAMQFADPSLPTPFDADQRGAIAQRHRVLELAAREDYLVAGAHLSFPGLGRVRAASSAYRWIPLDYSIPAETRRPASHRRPERRARSHHSLRNLK